MSENLGTLRYNRCDLVPGIKDEEKGAMLKRLFQADYFRIVVCDDDDTVEVCGALKVRLPEFSS